jgi:hypothetical protein
MEIEIYVMRNTIDRTFSVNNGSPMRFVSKSLMLKTGMPPDELPIEKVSLDVLRAWADAGMVPVARYVDIKRARDQAVRAVARLVEAAGGRKCAGGARSVENSRRRGHHRVGSRPG